MCAELGHSALPVETVASYIGKGADVLVHRVLTATLDGRADHEPFARAKESFYRHYRRFNGHAALVFPGVPGALADLQAGARFAAGVCATNSSGSSRSTCWSVWVSSSTSRSSSAATTRSRRKPHAAPVLAACERLNVSPADAVMIGDSENDLLGPQAGCRAILVEGGYNEGWRSRRCRPML